MRALAESRNEERDEGRSGVVGRGVRGLDVDRLALWSPLSPKFAILVFGCDPRRWLRKWALNPPGVKNIQFSLVTCAVE